MREPIQVIHSDQAIEILSGAEVQWRHDTGSAIVTGITHPDYGRLVLHHDAAGSSYIMRL